MLQHIRSIVQEDKSGQFRELGVFRSDSFLYLMSLRCPGADGLWTGELGVCSRATLDKLFRGLRALNRLDLPLDPHTLEVPVLHAARVERAGRTGELDIELCTDYETVSLYFSGHEKLELFLNDLEGALVWAA